MRYLPGIFMLIFLMAACSSSKKIKTQPAGGPVVGTASRPDTSMRTPSAKITPAISSTPVPNPKPLPPAPNPP